MITKNFKEILYEKDDNNGIVTISLNTPKRKNALSALTFLELSWAVEKMKKDESVKAMIMTGAKDPDGCEPMNEAFSSGGYFHPEKGPLGKNDASISNEVKEQVDFTDIAQKKLTLEMWQFEKPVIAAINGYAIGAGFTMPLVCADLIFASEHAWAQLPFVRLGIVPEFASTFLLPRILGLQKTKEIFFYGEKLTAQKLLELGLINKVLPHDSLMAYSIDSALKLVSPHGPGLAVKMTKKILHKPMIDALKKALDQENEGLNKTIISSDFIESINSRVERRKPTYKGR